MPWDDKDYPDSLKNFEPRVRNKAIEIANALLEEGYDEGRAIAIATAQAKEWNDAHPDHSIDNKGIVSSPSHSIRHVVPHEGSWAIKLEGSKNTDAIFNTKEEAVAKAKEMASDDNGVAIVHRKDGRIETSYNYR
ncbi:DUF2188 domain-containing protein [Paenibacillus oenotherae]|uniref:DUF2188 domain-containing protein n=1 Tax=Paenibacillus oenotherae TaxID=1435645 RepID=A0ABS7D608_9BACL|nr:DUF2188 domain-containing protein [Paenibacillus oenotherae]MBW7474921.1 DUF2188 domain-containing protein [Paenibacillus oenotherae]